MDAEEWIESFCRGFMCLLGIVGNTWLAIGSFPRRWSQIRTNEVLFINLATSNLITNYFVDLPDTMADFADRWFMGRTYCAIFLFCSDLSETSSIISTLLISIYWHQKLVGSLRRGTAPVRLDNLRLVGILLALGWGVAMVFSIPHFFFISSDTGSSDDCTEAYPSPEARKTYEVMYLTLANAAPIAGMVFFSIQIVITLLRHQKRILAMSSEVQGSAANPSSSKQESESKAKCGDDRTSMQDAGPADAAGSSDKPCEEKHAEPKSSEAHSAMEPSKGSGSSTTEAQSKGTAQPCPKEAASPRPKANTNTGNQVRAAKSVVAVASVFLVCWATHLLLRITSNVNESSVVVEVASYLAASYTCIIPNIFLYGVRKLSCSRKR